MGLVDTTPTTLCPTRLILNVAKCISMPMAYPKDPEGGGHAATLRLKQLYTEHVLPDDLLEL